MGEAVKGVSEKNLIFFRKALTRQRSPLWRGFTEDIAVAAEVQRFYKRRYLCYCGAWIDGCVHAIALEREERAADRVERLAKEFRERAVCERAAPEAVSIENDTVELALWNRLLHIFNALRRIKESRLEKLPRERAIGILRVKRLPTNEIRLFENYRRVARRLEEREVLRVVERRQVKPEKTMRIIDGVALLGPQLLLDELVAIRGLYIYKILCAPELREHYGVVDRFTAADERRRRKPEVRALTREFGGLVGENARLFETALVELAAKCLLHKRDGLGEAVCNRLDRGAALTVDRRLKRVEAVWNLVFAREIGKHALRLLAGLHRRDDVVGLLELHALEHAEERASLAVKALLRGLAKRFLDLVGFAPEERGVRLERADAAIHRVEDLGREEEVAPNERLRLVRREEVALRRLDPEQDRLATRRLVLDLGEIELSGIPEVVELARDYRRAKSAHHLVILRNDDFAAGELLEEERDGAVERDTALEENLAAGSVEKQLADRVEDRARLGLACAREQVADRNAVLELVDRRRGKNGANRAELGVGLVVDLVCDILDLDAKLCRDGVKEAASAGGANARHHARPELHRRVIHHALGVLAAAVDNSVNVGMEELRASHVRRNFADLEIKRDELARVLDNLATCHDYCRDVLERSNACNFEELKREALRRAASASATPRAMPSACDLARVDGLGALVDRALHLAVFAEEDGLESRRADVDAEVAFSRFCHCSIT